MMFVEYEELKKNFHCYLDNIKALNDACTIIDWDAATGAPPGGAALRSKNTGILSGLAFEYKVSDRMKEFLDALEGCEMDEVTRKLYDRCLKEYRRNVRIPRELVVRYNETRAGAERVWEAAKKTGDFELFAPHLEELVELKKRIASYSDEGNSLYDVMLKEYDVSLDMEMLDEYFDRLRGVLVPLLKKIQASGKQIDDSILHTYVPVNEQKKLSGRLMKIMGYDLNCGQLKESAHPFTTTFNKNDCRITTHYYENYHTAALYSVIHECGHALYEQGVDDSINGTLLCVGESMGLHESQSRFYENHIGRSRAFISRIFGELKECCPGRLEGVSEEAYYEAVNRVKPTLSRLEADELTYSLHIMIRYEIEKLMVEGAYDIRKLPEKWDELVKDYLGLEVTDNSIGILQDMHWSGGMIGYFPSYAAGSAYAAQFMAAMKKDMDVEKEIGSDNLAAVTGWLRERIHRYRNSLTPEQALLNATGEKFNPDYYISYLTEKYTKLYQI